jgi:sec-independent protein translocase protein TatC
MTDNQQPENLQMSLTEHLAELRLRLFIVVGFFIITFICCYFASEKIYQFLLEPFIEISQVGQGRRLIYTGLSEAFLTYLKLSFHSALFFSFPVFATQIYLFLAPALYKHEKKTILLAVFFSSFLFITGALFAYFLILPLAIDFFVGFEGQRIFESGFSVQLEARISEYLSFVTSFLIGFGIAFELPILLLFLIKFKVLSLKSLKDKRRYWIVIIFVISAILTPPDVMSQTILALALIILFEITLLIAQRIIKN